MQVRGGARHALLGGWYTLVVGFRGLPEPGTGPVPGMAAALERVACIREREGVVVMGCVCRFYPPKPTDPTPTPAPCARRIRPGHSFPAPQPERRTTRRRPSRARADHAVRVGGGGGSGNGERCREESERVLGKYK